MGSPEFPWGFSGKLRENFEHLRENLEEIGRFFEFFLSFSELFVSFFEFFVFCLLFRVFPLVFCVFRLFFWVFRLFFWVFCLMFWSFVGVSFKDPFYPPSDSQWYLSIPHFFLFLFSLRATGDTDKTASPDGKPCEHKLKASSGQYRNVSPSV